MLTNLEKTMARTIIHSMLPVVELALETLEQVEGLCDPCFECEERCTAQCDCNDENCDALNECKCKDCANTENTGQKYRPVARIEGKKDRKRREVSERIEVNERHTHLFQEALTRNIAETERLKLCRAHFALNDDCEGCPLEKCVLEDSNA